MSQFLKLVRFKQGPLPASKRAYYNIFLMQLVKWKYNDQKITSKFWGQQGQHGLAELVMVNHGLDFFLLLFRPYIGGRESFL
jgi:hypothetical protein